MTAAQQLARLQTVELSDSDVVIFYDGVNDILQGMYFKNAGGSIIETQVNALESLNPVQLGVTWLAQRPLLAETYLFRYYLNTHN